MEHNSIPLSPPPLPHNYLKRFQLNAPPIVPISKDKRYSKYFKMAKVGIAEEAGN